MDKKITGIIAYIGFIGWLVAYLAGDKEGAKFHLNQALVVAIFGIVCSVAVFVLGFIPVVGGIIGLVVSILPLVAMIMGIVFAAQDKEQGIPVIGTFKILK